MSSSKSKDVAVGELSPEPINPGVAVGTPLTMRELTEMLVKHYGLTCGLFDLLVEFQIGTGTVGPPDNPVPGAMIGFSRLTLVPASKIGPGTVDAADVSRSPQLASAVSDAKSAQPKRARRKAD